MNEQYLRVREEVIEHHAKLKQVKAFGEAIRYFWLAVCWLAIAVPLIVWLQEKILLYVVIGAFLLAGFLLGAVAALLHEVFNWIASALVPKSLRSDSTRIRQLEQQLEAVFRMYLDLYFEKKSMLHHSQEFDLNYHSLIAVKKRGDFRFQMDFYAETYSAFSLVNDELQDEEIG